MKPTNKITHYNNCIALTIKAIRILKGVKEIHIADALYINRSTYCRKENGITEITMGELRVISETINTSIYDILKISDFWNNFNATSYNKTALITNFLNYVSILINHQITDEVSKLHYKKVKQILLKKLQLIL